MNPAAGSTLSLAHQVTLVTSLLLSDPPSPHAQYDRVGAGDSYGPSQLGRTETL